MLRLVTEINVQQDFNKSCCIFTSVVGDVATEFNGLSNRNPRVSFSGHVESEMIQVDETFVDIHAEDDDDFEYQPASLNNPKTDTDNDLMTTDNDWASQGFDFLSRRPPRSQMPRFTNREQLNRGSCFF